METPLTRESEAKMEPDVHRDEDEAAAPASLPGKGRGRARRLATPEAVASPTEQLRQQQTPVQPATPPPSCSAGRGRGRPSPLKTQRVTQPPGSPQSGVVQRQPTPEATAAAAAITVTDRAPESTLNAETKADGQNCWKEGSAHLVGKESGKPGHQRSTGDATSMTPTVQNDGPRGQAASGGLSQAQRASAVQGSANIVRQEQSQGASMARLKVEQAEKNAAKLRPQTSGTSDYPAQLDPCCVGKGDQGTLAAEGDRLPPRQLIETAINDPDSMDAEQLKRLACSVVKAAAVRIANAEPAAFFCQMIISMERDPRFFHCLLDCCQQWYKRRNDWLPRRLWEEAGDDDWPTVELEGATFQWTAFVSFLAELIVAVMGEGRKEAKRVPASTALLPIHFFAWLLCDCFKVALRFPAADMLAEMKCFQFVLKRAGDAANRLAGSRVGLLVGHVREAGELFPQQVEPVLQELLRVRGSETAWLPLDVCIADDVAYEWSQ